jgi:hypothetical protein
MRNDRPTSALVQIGLAANPKALRAHMSLALCLWSVYLWNIAAPGVRDRAGKLKGTDSLRFRVIGSARFGSPPPGSQLIPITALGF